MISFQQVKIGFQTLIGVRDHYDITEIPSLGLTSSDSGKYIQDLHPSLRLDIIEAVKPDNISLTDFMVLTRDSAIQTLADLIMERKELYKYGQTLIDTTTLIGGNGYKRDVVVGSSKIVGLHLNIPKALGLKAIIHRVAIQTNANQNMSLYLYNIDTYEVTEIPYVVSASSPIFKWVDIDLELTGGRYYLGYYQDDLNGQAITNNSYNFISGPCSTCDKSLSHKWQALNTYMKTSPFYINNSDAPAPGDMIDDDNVIIDNSNNYGMNFDVSFQCDVSEFLIRNKLICSRALGLIWTKELLDRIRYSTEVNAVEERMVGNIIEDVKGDRETTSRGLEREIERAIDGIEFNFSNISSPCLPCASKTNIRYGYR